MNEIDDKSEWIWPASQRIQTKVTTLRCLKRFPFSNSTSNWILIYRCSGVDACFSSAGKEKPAQLAMGSATIL